MVKEYKETEKEETIQMEGTEKFLLSVKEVSDLTGLSEKTIRNLMKEHKFMVRIGRRTLIDRKKFEKWLDSLS